MGGAESKIQVMSKFSALSTLADIPPDDDIWNSILCTSIDPHELFSLVLPAEVRKVKESHPENFEVLLRSGIQRLSQISRVSAIGPNSEQPVLACVRVLTRVFPFVYEQDTTWSIKFVWESSPGKDSLGKDLIDILVKLLSYPGFTVDAAQPIWAPGIGCVDTFSTPARLIGNRVEILRLLLAVLSLPMYSKGKSYGLDYLVSGISKGSVAPLLCSLLNTTLQYHKRVWDRPFEENLVGNVQNQLATLSCITLVILVVHINEGKPNHFRRLLSKIHNEEDLDFLLKQSFQKLKDDTSLEAVSLFWELVQANPSVYSELVRSESHTPELTRVLVAKFKALRYEPQHQDTARILAYCMLDLSARPEYAKLAANEFLELLGPFASADVNLPVVVDIYYNISPFLATISPTVACKIVGFLTCLDTGTTASEELLERGLVATRIVVETQMEQAKPLVFELSRADWQESRATQWVLQLSTHVNKGGRPEVLEAVRMPPMAANIEYKSAGFSWDKQALRWYSSVLWGRAFQCENDRPGIGIWTNTKIELFKVETGRPKVTLARPRGAVDAVCDVVASKYSQWVRGQAPT